MLNNLKRKLFFIFPLMVMGGAMAVANSEKVDDFPGDDTPFGVRATNPEFDKIDIGSLVEPYIDAKGKRRTLNHYGYETTVSDRFSEHWLKMAIDNSNSQHPAVEIGAAYGEVVTLRALKAGATIVANDIDPGHLMLLRARATEKERERLTLNRNRFPGMEFEPESASSFLLRNVTHFLKSSGMENGISIMADALIPGGSITIVVMSPFHYLLKKFLPEYEKRWREGVLWPGEINDMHRYNPGEANDIPKYLHVMDGRPLIRAFKAAGFEVEEEGYFGFPHSKEKDPEQKAYYGIRAIKPKAKV